MIQSKHCDLCKYPKRNFESGLACGLTNKKPDFNVSCSNIKFSDSFKDNLHELLNQIEKIKKRRISVNLKSILLGILGLIIIFGNYPLLERTIEAEYGYWSYVFFLDALLFYIIGAGLISMAFLSLNKYSKELKILESEKRELNMILKNYKFGIESLLKSEIKK